MARLLGVSTSGYYAHAKRVAATVLTPRQQRRVLDESRFLKKGMRQEAAVSNEVEFAPKTVLAQNMLVRPLDAVVRATSVVDNEAYGKPRCPRPAKPVDESVPVCTPWRLSSSDEGHYRQTCPGDGTLVISPEPAKAGRAGPDRPHTCGLVVS
jgi:hypothetical protein